MLNNRIFSTLGFELKKIRKASGLKQYNVSAQTGLSVITVIKSEKGAGLLSSFTSIARLLEHNIAGRSLPKGNSLGESLAILRQRQKIPLRELSTLTGISVPTIISVEANQSTTLYSVERIAATLGAGLFLNHNDKPLSFFNTAATSSNYQAWTTPPELLDKLYPIVGGLFDLDPCSPTKDRKKAPVKAKVYHTGETNDDGLLTPWFGSVFVNPPYGRTQKMWIKKCHDEFLSGRVTVCIALIPARPDTLAWHSWIVNKADIFMLKGRLKFGGEGGEVPPFPSAIVVWNNDQAIIQRMKLAFPNAWHILK